MRRRNKLNTFRRLPTPLIAAFVEAGATVVHGPGAVWVGSAEVQIAWFRLQTVPAQCGGPPPPHYTRDPAASESNPRRSGKLRAVGQHLARRRHDHAAPYRGRMRR